MDDSPLSIGALVAIRNLTWSTGLGRVALASISSNVYKALSAVVLWVTTRQMVDRLGSQRFGELSVVVSITALLAFLDLGYGDHLISAAAKAELSGNRSRILPELAKIERTLWKVTAFTFGGLMIIWLLAGTTGATPNQRVFTDYWSIVAGAISSSGILLAIVLSPAAKVRIGWQETHLVNGFLCIGQLVCLVGLYVDSAWPTYSFYLLLFCNSYGPTIGYLLNRFCFRLAPSESARAGCLSDLSDAGETESSRSKRDYIVCKILGSVLLVLPGVGISLNIGPEAAAQYQIASRPLQMMYSFLASFLTPLWPVYASAYARGHVDKCRAILWKSVLIAIVAIVVLGGLYLQFFVTLTRALGGSAVAPPFILGIACVVGTLLLTIRAALSIFASSVGSLRVSARVFIGMGVVGASGLLMGRISWAPQEIVAALALLEVPVLIALSIDTIGMLRRGRVHGS